MRRKFCFHRLRPLDPSTRWQWHCKGESKWTESDTEPLSLSLFIFPFCPSSKMFYINFSVNVRCHKRQHHTYPNCQIIMTSSFRRTFAHLFGSHSHLFFPNFNKNSCKTQTRIRPHQLPERCKMLGGFWCDRCVSVSLLRCVAPSIWCIYVLRVILSYLSYMI